jgi:hypothetical protein
VSAAWVVEQPGIYDTRGLPLADVDGNGSIDALTDGLIVLRYLFGLTGDVLVEGVVASDATLIEASDIESYLESLML